MTQTAPPRTVTVIGGGIGGLTAALTFAQTGAKVFLVEQAPEITAVGAGIQITPNAARVLEALGLGDALASASIISQAVVPSDALTGVALARFPLDVQKPPYRLMHRAALIDVLMTACAAAGVEITLGAKVAMITDQDEVLLDTGKALATTDLTIFADGVKSIGRTYIAGGCDPFFTGQVAWRAVIDQDAPPEARIWMAPGRHVVSYPLPGNRLNIVAVQERDAWADEGWSHRADPADVQAAFADCAPVLRDLLAQIGDVHLWGLFRHDVALQWHRGRMVLLGDAAHPTLPFLAQGANMAIEDAYVLAQCVAKGGDPDLALEQYQALRRPRVTRAIAAANANAVNYHLRGVNRQVAHLGLRAIGQVAPKRFLGRLDWLYGHDVTR